MSAGSPSVQISFGANVQEIYDAYARFTAYVKANPVPVGPAGLGLSAQQLQAPFQQALGAAARNAAKEFLGELGGSGSGGGFLSGRGGSRGPLQRLLTGSLLAHGGLRALQSLTEYGSDYSRAGSSLERYRAEHGLQQRLFGIPYIGQAAELASFPFRYGTETVVAQAEQQARQNDAMQKAFEYRREQQSRAEVWRAGPPGSFQYRQQEIEFERKQANQQAAGIDLARVMEAERQKTEQQGTARTDTTIGKFLNATGTLLTAGILPPVLGKMAGFSSDSDAAEKEAQKDFDRRKEIINGQTRAMEALNAERAKAQSLEAEYQQHKQIVETKASAERAGLVYEHKPQVAEARGIYDQYEQEAEAYRHAGNRPAAANVLEEARYRIMHERERLMLGGSASEAENPLAVDLSGTNQTFMGQSRGQYDDTGEAIKELGNKLDAITSELRAINKGVN